MFAGQQQRAEIELGLNVFRVQRDRPLEFLVGAREGAELHVRLGQIVVRGSVVLVNLDGVGELDDGFLLLALGRVGFATLQILRLLHVGIAVASLQKTCTDR